MSKVHIVVPGVTGRMGRLIAKGALADGRFALVGASARAGRSEIGHDVGGVLGHEPVGLPVLSSLELVLEELDDEARARACVIDFTGPDALAGHVATARKHKVPLLVGTTGLSAADARLLDEAAAEIPVLLAANTSLGANLLAAFSALAAKALPDAEVEIVELHHRAKKDAPSGTALMLGRAVADAREEQFDVLARTTRTGHTPREPGEIGVFGVRGGTVAGEHTVYFFLDDERVELTHRVTDRAIFARGALTAAAFLVGKAPGRYQMRDVLGLGADA